MTALLAVSIVLAWPLQRATAQESAVSTVASAFAPDTVLAPTGGPRVVLLSSPGEGVAALRLSIPFQEGPTEAGAGWLLRDLALERMQALARPIGAEVSATRTPWGVAYAVVGAAADFEYLAYLLREAAAAPAVDGPDFPDALRRLREAAGGVLETPRGSLTTDLRTRIAPGVLPPEGTAASAAAMDGARVREVWLRTHQASRMTLVVSAPVIPEVVLAATREIGAPESAWGPALDATVPDGPRRPRPEAIRTWVGEAWQVMGAGDPHGPVAAILVSEHLRSVVRDFETSVELWELPDRWVLAVVGAAYRGHASAMRRAVSGAVEGTLASLTPEGVARVKGRLQADLLVRSRTPAGLVSVVGRALEADGDPMAATRTLEVLDRVDAATTRRFMEALLDGSTVTAEVRP